jgi:hypothetical protein
LGLIAGLDFLEKRKIVHALGIELQPSGQWPVAVPTDIFPSSCSKESIVNKAIVDRFSIL